MVYPPQSPILTNLDKPGQEEDKRNEVDKSPPGRQTVDGTVHQEHPAFLRGGFIHSEKTGSCGNMERPRINACDLTQYKEDCIVKTEYHFTGQRAT